MTRRRSRTPAVSGVLVVDKPAGMTSFDVVRQVRQRLRERKAGHTGTLDPMATGVLPVCLGEATKIAGLLTAEDKVYRALAELGRETDTLDVTGTETARHDPGGVDREHVVRALAAMLGEQLQVPPAYSAVRVGGERAHERARRGEQVELAPRRIHVMELELTRWEPPTLELHVTCSKGTYVRSLVADLGRALGCGAVLSGLRRTRSGPFSADQALPLEQVGPDTRPLGIDRALEHLPALEVDASQADGLRHGQPFSPADPQPVGTMIRLRCAGELVALGEVRAGRVWPRRVLVGHHPVD